MAVTGVSATVFMYWEYPVGHVAQEHEKQISKRFPSFFTKNDIPDGFTETIEAGHIERFLFIQDNLYREAIWQD